MHTPECKKCGLLKSTVDSLKEGDKWYKCMQGSEHDFGTVERIPDETRSTEKLEWQPEEKTQELMGIFQLERTNAITEMFDNGYGENCSGTHLYPTSRFFERLDVCVQKLLNIQEEKFHSELEKYKEIKRKEVEDLRQGSCNCVGSKNECEHWGRHETIDDVLEILKS